MLGISYGTYMKTQPPFLFLSNPYGFEKPWIANWFNGKVGSVLVFGYVNLALYYHFQVAIFVRYGINIEISND